MNDEVRWMPRARRQAAAQRAWWVEQRSAALMRFREELARVVSLLEQYPELGIIVHGREIRRLLMPETEQFLYHRVRPRAARIEVIALWVPGGKTDRRCRGANQVSRDANETRLPAGSRTMISRAP